MFKSFTAQAKKILDSVQGQTLSHAERTEHAIALAALLLQEAQQNQTADEFLRQKQLSRMLGDPLGKVFTAAVADQCFRSTNPARTAQQLIYLLDQYGIPQFLSWNKKTALAAFRVLGTTFPNLLMPFVHRLFRKETAHVILPGEPQALQKHLHKRQHENIKINLNHLGEAILSEAEAQRRLQLYLDDLANPDVQYVSIKISTLYSQLNLVAYDQSLASLSAKLRQLYRAAQQSTPPKFVNLDMEEYRDLHCTLDLFRGVLDEAEFQQLSAGVVLQSYIPDSYIHQQELTRWAVERVKNGGAPIKIRLVKGANLAMEQVDACIKGWDQAPFCTKEEVDANFLKMMLYGCTPERIRAVHLGIGSHNLFDLAYALVLRKEKSIESFVTMEMLEGMAEPMRRAVQYVSEDMLLYCPVAIEAEFQYALAYLIRRLDENTAPDNFLRQAFSMVYGDAAWQKQVALFRASSAQIENINSTPRRQQNRLASPPKKPVDAPFENESDTDWSLPQNRAWGESILQEWSNKTFDTIPLVVDDHEVINDTALGEGRDPSRSEKVLYRYTLGTSDQANRMLDSVRSAAQTWNDTAIAERSALLANVAHALRVHRAELIGAMVTDTGKTLVEADVEISEAIDFAEYYRRTTEELHQLKDVAWVGKGVVLVASPWNFPCSIPAGGILAALMAGNSVIFKPAPEAVLVGWMLVQIFWEAGIPRKCLQFFTCDDEPVGSSLIQDARVNAIILTGATATARLFLQKRPDLELHAETGGKNTLIITAMADRDLAIKDLLQSAFGYAGQKCSACSLAICEAEVYDDPHFRNALREAAASLVVGPAWNLETKVNPLIRPPNATLMRGLTTLENGEEWLLEPKVDPSNPQLWTPGIKWGVQPQSFTHQNELFGPVLGVMRADSLGHALQLANGTPYGLTAGIHSLDEREQLYWIEHIEAGNCYINRGITGAVVQRQPFGGCKQSSFGTGAKAGGPNYVVQLMHPTQRGLPQEREEVDPALKFLLNKAEKNAWNQEQQTEWQASIESYTFFWKHYFSQDHDPSLLLGQDNFLRYMPLEQQILRVNTADRPLDILRVRAAAATCGSPLEISEAASDLTLMEQMKQCKIQRLRCLSAPPYSILQCAAENDVNVIVAPVVANGRIELLQHLREVSLSIDYHRYGYLGIREGEERAASNVLVKKNCVNCSCHG